MLCLWRNDLLTRQNCFCVTEIFPAAGKTTCQPDNIPQNGRAMALLLVVKSTYQGKIALHVKSLTLPLCKMTCQKKSSVALPLATPSSNLSSTLSSLMSWQTVFPPPCRLIQPVQLVDFYKYMAIFLLCKGFDLIDR